MGGVHKPGAEFGAPMPMNTLNGNNLRNARSAPPSSPRTSRSSPPPTKRQKVESDADAQPHVHTRAQFVPLPDGLPEYSRSRKRSAESIQSLSDSQLTVSVQSSNTKQSQSNVSEFRNSERFVKTRTPKRPRHRAPEVHIKQRQQEHIDGTSHHEPLSVIDKDDVKMEAINDRGPDASSRPKNSIPVQKHAAERETTHHLSHYSNRYRNMKGSRSATLTQLGKIIDKTDPRKRLPPSVDSSEDELANNDNEMVQRLPYKTRRPVASSVSRKNDIKPTKFGPPKAPPSTSGEMSQTPVLDYAKEIISSPLRIVRGVSGHYKYQATEESVADQCFLSLREVSTLLHPTDKDGERLEKYSYLNVNLKKTTGVVESAERCLVTVSRSIDAGTSSAPKLTLEFSSRGELERFKQWVALDRKDPSIKRIDIRPVPVEKHDENFQKWMERAKQTAVPIDGTSPDTVVGDDVKLIEHNMEARSREMPKKTDQAHGHTNRAKLKDTMGSSYSTPVSLTDNRQLAESADSRQLHHANHVQVQRPARTTRATLTLKSSPEPTFPEHESWTIKNPGWQTNWRNSLVFPAHGKNRAIVDKDDIHRLDEGQFLNDNLVIFYLRYLQDKLETKKPDLARRIYFQNTFFYDKLKSTKGQGINYDSVKAWTSKVDLFTKDYIIVPINEYTHWYVAIIYNAPKLLPSPQGPTESKVHQRDSITIDDDDDDVVAAQARAHAPRPNGTTSDILSSDAVVSDTQNEVIDYLSHNRRNLGQDDTPSTESNNPIHSINSSDDSRIEVERTQTPSGNQNRKKTGKRHSTGLRKHSPDQPKIITLDSLGGSHSPTCSILKQYLVAELKDKKNIEITPPGALGMTAKGVPEQSNHCDCGLYLLGYIQEFLKDPDKFVHSILQHDDSIAWNFNPSELRNNIRELIFKLQKEQQSVEDASRERKRQAAILKKEEQSGVSSAIPEKSTSHPENHNDSPTRLVRASEGQDPLADSSGTTSKPAQPSLENQNDTELPARKISRGASLEEEGGRSNNTPEVLSSPKKQSKSPEVVHIVSDISSFKEGTKVIPRPNPAIQEARPKRSQSPTPISKGPQIPGAFPASPFRENSNKGEREPSTATDSGEEIQRSFLPPIGSPCSKGTPTNPMLVDDSEAALHSTIEDTPEKRQPSFHKKSPIAVVLPSLQSRSDHHHHHVNTEAGTGEQPTIQSHYFAGRQRGDKMPSAKLREEPVENSVIDISD